MRTHARVFCSILFLFLLTGCHDRSQEAVSTPPVSAPTVASDPPTTAPDNFHSTETILQSLLWQTFTSEDGSFAISMPGKPKGEQVSSTSRFGKIGGTTYYIPGEEIAYIVGYDDYPADKAAHASPASLLEDMVSAIRQKPGCEILDDHEVTMNRFPGRDLLISYNSSTRIHERLFWVRHRMYMLNLTYKQTQDYSKETTRFFDSFKLLK